MSWPEILVVSAMLVALLGLMHEVHEMKRDVDRLIDSLPPKKIPLEDDNEANR
jgi:hypothetical protein